MAESYVTTEQPVEGAPVGTDNLIAGAGVQQAVGFPFSESSSTSHLYRRPEKKEDISAIHQISHFGRGQGHSEMGLADEQ